MPGVMKTITTTKVWLLLLSLELTGWPYAMVHAQALFDFEREPIHYHTRPASNVVTRLQSDIDSGQVQLVFQQPRGYLDSILQYLKISKSTQSLVFSKSSAQLRKISPSSPRALYFNEQAYVGWVQRGEVIELIASDPELGAVFYSLKQVNEAKPRLLRDEGQCLQCHARRRTRGVPGPVVRSLYTDSDGQPILNFGHYVSDHTSPFSERWGGYYVTGTHGKMLHMGNLLADRSQQPAEIDYSQGANITDLSGLFDTRPYLSADSDIVALMVLEHQSQMQNLITLAHYEEVRGESYVQAGESSNPNFRSDLSQRLVARAGNDLLKYMLFTNEFSLQAPVRGTSGFARQFSARGPRDRQGRSLYQLDLTTRLFKYPMSYMVYNESFRKLPFQVMAHIRRELRKVLTASTADDDYAHLSLEDRRAILEILQDTCPELADGW